MNNLHDFIERVFASETPSQKRERGEKYLDTKKDDDWKQLSWKSGAASTMFYENYIDASKIRYYGHLAEPNRPFKEIYYFAFLDKATAQTIKEGLYVVYLLSADHKSMLLCLAVGVTNSSDIWSSRIPELKNSVDTSKVSIDLSNHRQLGESEKAREYLSSIVCYKEYSHNAIPDNEELETDFSEMMQIYASCLSKYSGETVGGEEASVGWWPSLVEYTPGLSKEQWLETLNDGVTFTENALAAIAEFYAYGGEATCAQLAEKYGRTSDFYRNSLGVKLAGKVKDKYNLPDIENGDENSKRWPIVFQGRKATKSEQGYYVWKIRDELYEALTEFKIERYLVKKGGRSDMKSTKEAIQAIKDYIAARGFSYEGSLIENFYLSLKSKPFVILAGTSGTGKTRLVKLFAEAIDAHYSLVPVRPDWSDGNDLFGHMDINGTFVSGPVCESFNFALENPDKPVFLCLDEMNLARVEYYLSDFLSVIESRERDKDGKISTDGIAQYKNGIPNNLYIIGTVNMDETTFPFSKKVLDRANTIEFNFVKLNPDFDTLNGNSKKVDVPRDFLRTEYLVLAKDCVDEKSYIAGICDKLESMNRILQKANAHVGYRVRDEIVFYMLNNKKAGLLEDNVAFDNEIMQKILPRIQGSSAQIKDMLIALFKYCRNSASGLDEDSKKLGETMKTLASGALYPTSAEKIGYMMTRYEEDGFTSYWL